MITLEYRPVQPNDLNELKQLHELFFPLSYSDAFYNRAVKGIGIHGKRLYSIIVIDNIINENNIMFLIVVMNLYIIIHYFKYQNIIKYVIY